MEKVWDKVVKIDNVAPSSDAKDEALSLVITENSNHDEIVPVEHTSSPTATSDTSLPSLPAAWPNVPQLFYRCSWDFTTATSPSINKATEHLVLLQSIIQDWTKDNEQKLFSRLSTNTPGPVTSSSHETEASGQRRQLRFITSSTRGSTVEDDARSSSRSSLLVPSEYLSIQGIGAHPDQEILKEEKTEEEQFEIVPYLGADEVMEEVIALLAHLEKDRRETKEALHHEQNRYTSLSDKIDSLSQQRMTQLPVAVQKEHEACAMDINELNWHVSYRSRVLARIENKVATAEVLSKRLKEDIAFVQKHCPLVEEKLELESDAMNRIKNAQSETNDELGNTVERCAKAENKSEEAFSKAEAERTHIKNDLAAVEKDLAVAREELAEAKKTHDVYIHQCNSYRNKLKANAQELQVQEVKCENAKVAETMQAARISNYEARIVEEKFEQKRLSEDNIMKEAALEMHHRESSNAEEKMTTTIQQNEIKLKGLTRSNQELELDIEDLEIKIKLCENQKIADEKNLARMAKEMERTHEQIRATEEQLSKMWSINDALHDKLNKEKETYALEENQLMEAVQELQKRVADEKHERAVMQARIMSCNKDMDKQKLDMRHEEVKRRKMSTDIERQVKAVLDKVTIQRQKHAEIKETLQNVQEQLKAAQTRLKELLDKTAKEKSDLLPVLSANEDDLRQRQEQLEHMKWKIENMTQNINDMTAFQDRMEKTKQKTDREISTLQDELDDLTVEINTKLYKINETRSQLDQVNARYRDQEKRHRDHMKERENVFVNTENEFEQSIEMNKELAASYRTIQNEYIKLKNTVLDKYNECLKLEHHIKDLKQVKGLQARLHHALLQYYKVRGLYTQAELNRMAKETTANAVMVGKLNDSMDGALDEIKTFLKCEMTGSKAHEMAIRKVMQEQAAGKIVNTVNLPKKLPSAMVS